MLAALPLEVLHADDGLSRFLDAFEQANPGCQLGLQLAGEDVGPARRAMVQRCDGVRQCALREGASRVCMGCRERGQHRRVCRLGDGTEATAALLLDTPRAAGRGLVRLLEDSARGVDVAAQVLRHKRSQQRKQATFQHGALARELHDSVAQQLGYLSFQASLLQGRLNEPAQATAMLGELRAALGQLQRQVRELITSARLTMDGRSLRQALADSVAEFSRRCIIVFELDNRLADDALNPETELQILQIIREALANVVRHSHARHVRIELRQGRDGSVSVTVQDDGIGLGPASVEDNHYGLAIIRERASSIGARLTLDSVEPHGARVHLSLAAAHAEPHADPSRSQQDEQHHLIADR
ncbi:ATP-binding protein [Pseudomonas sp. dw_358]|uniref:ATP-binding protein n=1 Tax=Pseudomonas sp. dw_358 TaxID=2720083 RepID=UPI00211667E3|nr:ATP-binding protein [Pseudomonas sp. dw_358]